jgi:hypothetical protein
MSKQALGNTLFGLVFLVRRLVLELTDDEYQRIDRASLGLQPSDHVRSRARAKALAIRAMPHRVTTSRRVDTARTAQHKHANQVFYGRRGASRRGARVVMSVGGPCRSQGTPGR